MSGITFDTGALIALVDRKRLSMRKVFDAAQHLGVPIHVPAVVVAEWWRSGHREKERTRYIRAMHVVATDQHLARLAGSALTLVRRATTIDAIVMVTAAHFGDLDVYTSDRADLEALRDGVPLLADIKVTSA
jgi:predicted nucleic acid-binding protein